MYPLNGDINDYSGNNNHLSGVVTYTSNGKIGQAVDYNYPGVLTSTLPSIYKGRVSVAYWGRGTGLPSTNYRGVLKLYDSNNTSYLYIDTRTSTSPYILNTIKDYTLSVWSTQTPITNIEYIKYDWNHYVITIDELNWKSYRNGELIISNDITVDIAPYTNISSIKLNFSGSNAFNINDVRIYDHILSDKEIKELSKAKVLHYTFNDFKEPTTNYHPYPLNLYSWVTSGYNCILSEDGTAISPVSGRSMKMVTIGRDPRTNTNQNSKWNISEAVSGQTWTASCYVKANRITTSYSQLFVFEVNSSNNYIQISATNFIATTSWQRISVTRTFTDPLTAYVQIRLDGPDTFADGDILWWDGIQVEKKSYSTEFVGTRIYSKGTLVWESCDLDGIIDCYVEDSTEFVNGTRTGSIKDMSGYSNDSQLTESTTPKWISDSKLGSGCYYFNGINDSLDLGNMGSLVGFTGCTISFWRKNDSVIKSWLPFFGQASGYYMMATSNGVGEFYHGNIGSSINIYKDGISSGSSPVPFTDQLWHHYVITNVNLSTWTLIRYSGYYGFEADGYLDDVRIYNSILSSSDILELYQTRAQLDNTGNLYLNELTNIGSSINLSESGQGNFADLSEVGITDGLTGYWKLDGDAKDYSGYGNNGTISGATVSSGLKNLAYNFDGINQYIIIPNTTGYWGSDTTLSWWEYDYNTTNKIPISIGSYNNSGIYVHRNSHVTANGASLSNNLIISGLMPINTWTHYVIRYIQSSRELRFYKNGISAAFITTTFDIVSSNWNINLGIYNQNISWACDCKITQVKIFNRALSDNEILIEYKYGLTTTGMQLTDNGTLYTNNEIIEGL